jgi:transposase
MSYNLTLDCGCVVWVACHPRTGVAHTRVIEFRGPACQVRRHEVGLRLYLWELLPQQAPRTEPAWADPGQFRWR